MLCDQPFVFLDLINQLVARYQATNSLIVASEYAGVFGVPTIFPKTLFSELALFQGDIGAREIIRQHY